MNREIPGGDADVEALTSRPVTFVDLHWIPLGAGERVVRFSGKVFESLSAMTRRRQRRDLYHSALVVVASDGRYVIEMAPIVDSNGERRGVVAEGPVGLGWLGHFRLFRYEIRRWREGIIPDADATVSTMRLSIDRAGADHLLELLPSVPTPVWGRDELDAGEMWNSNSVTSWLLTSGGFDVGRIEMPPGGRAPGWDAGLVVARRRLET